MNLIDLPEHHKVDCIFCFATSKTINFRLLGIEKSGTGFNCLFECPACYTQFSKLFENFSMRKKLLMFLTTQNIIGKTPYKRQVTSFEQWYYELDKDSWQYDFSERKKFKQNQNGDYLVGV